jgi:hypothetical protein
MRILCNILVVLFVTTTAVGQQINPVPDYIFRNSMSVGRNAPTDTSAYFSIGPRFGATRGFMPPMVTDTASVTGTKRNGLLIYSIQRNSFLYWDSTGMRWSRIAANLDTLLLSTRAWRQKGDDSLAALIGARVGGSGTTNRVPKFTASGTIGNGSIADSSSSVRMTILSGGNIGVATAAPAYNFDVTGTIRNTQNTFLATDGVSEVYIGTTTDAGAFLLQVNGGTRIAGDINTTGLISTGKLRLFETGLDNISSVSSELFLNSVTTVFRNSPANSYTPRYGQINQTGLSIGTSVSNHAITIDKGNATASYIQFAAGTKTGNGVNDGFHLGIDTSGNAEIRQRENLDMLFYTNNTDRGRLSAAGELWLGYTADQGSYILQANGNGIFNGSLTTSAPNGGTAASWKLGIVVAGSYTAASNYLQVDVGGTLYYIGLVTPN